MAILLIPKGFEADKSCVSDKQMVERVNSRYRQRRLWITGDINIRV